MKFLVVAMRMSSVQFLVVARMLRSVGFWGFFSFSSAICLCVILDMDLFPLSLACAGFGSLNGFFLSSLFVLLLHLLTALEFVSGVGWTDCF